ncbi:unnamed protein product [Trichobilharzia regenti]|nr:unnamed protein product [Trichobilharzia regenti]
MYDDFSRPPGETPPYQPCSGVVHLSGHANTGIDLCGSSYKRDFDANDTVSMISFTDSIGPTGDSTVNANSDPPPTPSLRLTKIRHNGTPSQTPKPCRDRFERPGLPNLYLKPVSTQPVSEMTLSKQTDDGLFLGSNSGAIAWVNVEEDGLPIELFHGQTSSIRRLAHTRDEARYAEFSNTGHQDRLVATYGKMAKFYSISPSISKRDHCNFQPNY